MSKSVEETRRELFEVLAETKGLNLWYRFKGGDYADEIAASAWWAFNAALDAVEIELPALKNSNSYHDGGDVYDSAINQCRYKIESLNLGIEIK